MAKPQTPNNHDISLESRVERLEAEVKEMRSLITYLRQLKEESPKAKPTKSSALTKILEPETKKPQAKPKKVSTETVELLAQLTEARDKGDKKLQAKIRKQLRKSGYSLRNNNK